MKILDDLLGIAYELTFLFGIGAWGYTKQAFWFQFTVLSGLALIMRDIRKQSERGGHRRDPDRN